MIYGVTTRSKITQRVYFGGLCIQLSNINEERDSAHGHIEGIRKTFLTTLNNWSNATAENLQKTLEIQALLSKVGDIPIAMSQRALGSFGSIDMDSNAVSGANLGGI